MRLFKRFKSALRQSMSGPHNGWHLSKRISTESRQFARRLRTKPKCWRSTTASSTRCDGSWAQLRRSDGPVGIELSPAAITVVARTGFLCPYLHQQHRVQGQRHHLFSFERLESHPDPHSWHPPCPRWVRLLQLSYSKGIGYVTSSSPAEEEELKPIKDFFSGS